MKEFFKEYLKIFTYLIIGFIFMISSYYLFINYFHSSELKNRLYISNNELSIVSYNEKLNKIDNNLKTFSNKKNQSNTYKNLYNKLLSCHNVMQSEGSLSSIKFDSYLSSNDIYNLGVNFQGNHLNLCWALGLSYMTDEKNKTFKDITPFVVENINNITKQVNFALSEIQNNSSYFYSTNITTSTIRNAVVADYELIANSYNSFANIILELSEYLNEKNNSESGDINA